MAMGKMSQGSPSGLAQPKRAETLIQFLPPNAGGFLDELSDLLGIHRGHR